MAVPPTSDDDRSGVTSTDDDPAAWQQPAPQRPQRRAPRVRIGLGIALVLALVVSGGVLVWLVSERRGAADAEQAQREQVMAQAEQFMLRVNTYGPDLLEGEQMPEYRKLVSEVITPKFDADFEKNVPANEQIVAQSKLARTCQVFATGVSSIDADSAVALVAGAFVNSYPKTPGATERINADPAPFRVQVKLVKVKGTWLVDDFTPVTGTDADQQSPPSSDPTGVPTGVPSSAPPSPADPSSTDPSSGSTP